MSIHSLHHSVMGAWEWGSGGALLPVVFAGLSTASTEHPRAPSEVAAFMSAHSKTPYINPSMGFSSIKGVVRGRRGQQLGVALSLSAGPYSMSAHRTTPHITPSIDFVYREGVVWKHGGGSWNFPCVARCLRLALSAGPLVTVSLAWLSLPSPYSARGGASTTTKWNGGMAELD